MVNFEGVLQVPESGKTRYLHNCVLLTAGDLCNVFADKRLDEHWYDRDNRESVESLIIFCRRETKEAEHSRGSVCVLKANLLPLIKCSPVRPLPSWPFSLDPMAYTIGAPEEEMVDKQLPPRRGGPRKSHLCRFL